MRVWGRGTVIGIWGAPLPVHGLSTPMLGPTPTVRIRREFFIINSYSLCYTRSLFEGYCERVERRVTYIQPTNRILELYMDLKILCQIAAHAQKQQKAAVCIILFQDEMIYIRSTLGSLVVVKKLPILRLK